MTGIKLYDYAAHTALEAAVGRIVDETTQGRTGPERAGGDTAGVRQLRDFADGGRARREREAESVTHLLSLSHHAPMRTETTDNPLADMVLKQVKR